MKIQENGNTFSSIVLGTVFKIKDGDNYYIKTSCRTDVNNSFNLTSNWGACFFEDEIVDVFPDVTLLVNF